MTDFETTADPQRFDEAVEWFRKRVVLTEKEAQRLGTEAGRRAFWIGGGLQLAQIQRVFDKIATAQANATPFEEWRNSVRSELQDDAHASLVFRNATQRSLIAGRWRQMREPGVLAFRPYWLFDGIRDSRQSKICKRCSGPPPVCLPAEHPWWATHTPPLHHACRSSIRNLRSSEAHRRGITNVPPIDSADDGFGHSPEGEPEWKPEPKKTDLALLKELERKQAEPPPPPPKPAEPPKEHDPKHWEEHYREKYGDAAGAVGWGKAMLERGLDRSPAEHIAELRRLQRLGVPGEFGQLIHELQILDANRPIRSVGYPTARAQYAAMLSEHSLSIQRGVFFEVRSDDPRIKEAVTFYRQLADKALLMPRDLVVQSTPGARAYFSSSKRLVEIGSNNTSVAVHELAHAIETSDGQALSNSLSFLAARTKGENLQKLRDLTGTSFDHDEVARPDKFIHPYIGKDYGKIATEVTSMGYQAMAGDNDLLRQLQVRDKEMLFFLLGQLAGRE